MTNDFILQTNGLTKNFGSLKAVNNLNLHVEPGSIYGFLGRNGAGKTTTIRMLMGIISPDKGNISILGQKSKRITRKQKQLIGYVSQENNFYQWMTCKDIGEFASGFYKTWDKDEYSRLLKTMDMPINRKIGELSGGMKVKAGLALALAHRPELLILDEPTSGLDPAARKEFLEMVANQARKYGRTTFFSSHIISEVEQICSHISIIDKGSKKFEGTIDSLRGRIKKILIPNHPVELNKKSDIRQALLNSLNENFISQIDQSSLEILAADRKGDGCEILLNTDFNGWEENIQNETSVHSLPLEDIFISLTSKEVVL